jgi:hypothetical protein
VTEQRSIERLLYKLRENRYMSMPDRLLADEAALFIERLTAALSLIEKIGTEEPCESWRVHCADICDVATEALEWRPE